MKIQVNQTLKQTYEHLNQKPTSDWETFKKAYEITKKKITNDKSLISLSFLPHLELLPHQSETVEKVLYEMHGRAILADEVGLGKTIEAGVILKELMIKGRVNKVLILVPSSLINQWEIELNQKFYIPARAKHRSYPWDMYEIVISSIDLAKKSPHSEEILKQNYDMLIVDEAHRLKNSNTKNYQFVKQIQATYCLLLTATPIQNKLDEIYHLIQLVRPGLLGDKKEFKARLKNNPEAQEAIKQLIQTSMVRNLRKEVRNQSWTSRSIETIRVPFSEEEKDFYDKLDQRDQAHPLQQLTLKRGFCSSREACYHTLSNHQSNEANELIEELKELPHHSKAAKTVELVEQIGDKCIIFTEYKSTQLYLQYMFHQAGKFAVTYNGDFKKSKKQWMLQLFENQADVLIATDAGAEGLNLQHCKHMIHYDLPWNPMKLEQRIGRIHRYGQTSDVSIYYMIVENTIDEHVLGLLYEKLELFEGVIGELDQILGDLGLSNIEEELKEILAYASSDQEASIKMHNLIEVVKSHHEERDAYNESS